MSNKKDLYTGRGIGQAVRDTGRETHKEGSFLFVEENGERVYFPDTSRTLPKPVRERILGALVKMGVLAAVLGMVIALILNS